ncbi:MAG: ATP synthase F1 subunit epsilon [Bacteroidaceae bacterium]|nr:ATP synthase F1 subunit epsilon [Bacteroidaceae bacterium]
MKLTIVSPERVLYRGEAQSVTVPGARGQFEVLDNHAPIISTLQAGTLSYKAETTEVIEIQGGFIDVANNEVSVCVEV